MLLRLDRLRWLVPVLALTVLGLAACSDSEDEPQTVTVTISEDSLDVADSLKAGVATINVVGGAGDIEVDFTQVAEGTTEEEFVAAIRSASQGGTIPDLLVATSGVAANSGEQSILLGPGQHFVWVEIFSDDPAAESTLLVSAVDVTGELEGELPETSGTITALDYGFNVDVEAGDQFTFRNDGPEQLHHAVLIDFGDLSTDVVKENLPAFFAAGEGEAPPPAFASLDFERAFVGGSAVVSSGLATTFGATLQSGHTYGVVCFIQDRAGGPPHALAYNMFDAFTVE